MNYPVYGYQPQPMQSRFMNQQPAQQQSFQQYIQQPVSMPQSNVQFICRPVASEEEAIAAATPFDGSILVLTDFSHGKIYTKSINYTDGSPIFQTFANERKPAFVESNASMINVEYAQADTVRALQEELNAVKEEIASMQQIRSTGKKTAKKGDEAE